MKFLSALFVLSSVLCLNVYAEGKNSGRHVSVSGFLQWDYTHFDDVYNQGEAGSEFGMRRARLIFKGKIDDDLSFKMMPNFNNSKKTVELFNAFIRYSGFALADVTVGRFKEPFGMEALSSALWTQTLERSSITSKPMPILAGLFIDSGVMVSHHKQNYGWAVAAVKDGAEDEFGKDLIGFTGRFYGAPIQSFDRLLHLGISHAVRDFSSSINTQWKAPLGVAPARKFEWLNVPTENVVQTGIELAMAYKGLGFQSEWMRGEFDAVSEADLHTDSGYITLTYNSKGNMRKYRKGVFGSYTNIQSPLLEWVAKFDHQRVNQNGVEDKKADTMTLGVNAFMSQRFKLGVNWVRTSTKGFGLPESGKALISRIQVKF